MPLEATADVCHLLRPSNESAREIDPISGANTRPRVIRMRFSLPNQAPDSFVHSVLPRRSRYSSTPRSSQWRARMTHCRWQSSISRRCAPSRSMSSRTGGTRCCSSTRYESCKRNASFCFNRLRVCPEPVLVKHRVSSENSPKSCRRRRRRRRRRWCHRMTT